MTDQLTSTGLHIDTLEDRLDRVVGLLRAAISPTLDLSTDQPSGQFVKILTEHVQEVVELLQELHSSIDPEQATGAALDALCSITGTYRKAATKGTVTLTLTATGACTVSAGSVVAVTGDPDNRWVTDADVVFAAAGSQSVSATAATAGRISAPAGTITTIVTPVTGWSAVTNPSDASEGRNQETDTELRLRREQEITQSGAASLDSIRAAVLALDDVEECVVYENATWHVDGAGRPPHSIEVLFWSALTGASLTALEASIAAEIFAEKAAGIQAVGTTLATVQDDAGNSHTVGMTLATAIKPTVEVWLFPGSNYAGDAAVQEALVDWGDENLQIAEDIYHSALIAVVMGVQGVENVTSLKIGGAAATYSIGETEIGVLETANIVVHS